MRALSSLCGTATGLASRCPKHRRYGTFLRAVLPTSLSQAHHGLELPAAQSKLITGAVSNIRRSTRLFSSQSKNVVFPDPYRPDLFYHLLNPPTPLAQTLPAFGLSFLYERPPSVDSTEIIGWLPAQLSESASDSEAHTNVEEGDEDHSTLQDFRENPKFVSFLHQVIQMGLNEGIDDVWKDAARQLQHGWMHIHDQRNPPDQGRIGDPDDIIGTVLVHDSKIKAETYQPMPSYRLCTADGVLQLTPGLSSYLKRVLLAQTTLN